MKNLSWTLSMIVLSIGMFIAGCGNNGKGAETGGDVPPSEPVVIEEQGKIEPGDATDPNHGNLAYDAYTFDGLVRYEVTVEAETEGFSPILKLVEVSTGAVIAEWDAEYPTGEALTYTLAGPGTYEARIYGGSGGTGSYSLRITLER